MRFEHEPRTRFAFPLLIAAATSDRFSSRHPFNPRRLAGRRRYRIPVTFSGAFTLNLIAELRAAAGVHAAVLVQIVGTWPSPSQPRGGRHVRTRAAPTPGRPV